MYAGTDADGNKQHFYATVRGTGRKAEREAKQKEGELLAKAAAGHVRLGRSRSTSSPTIGWQSPVTRSPLATTEIFLDRHVWPALGKKRIEKIGPADLNRLYLALEAGSVDRAALAPSTVVRIHGIIRACLELAVTNDWIVTNPAARARPPRQVQKVPESPDLDSVKAMLSVAYETDKEMYAFLRLASAVVAA